LALAISSRGNLPSQMHLRSNYNIKVIPWRHPFQQELSVYMLT
jgi:hypothetical protein